MKKLFFAIRHGDIETIKELVTEKPELMFCTAKPPPKKDDGQSPLQVAIKTGHFEIVEYLLDSGADVNFMESEDSENSWRIPVLQDAIMASILSSRWNTNDELRGLKVYRTKKDADSAYHVLERMLSMGADISSKDSFGNSCLDRACLDAAQILPRYNWQEDRIADDRVLTKELRDDLLRIFKLLFKYGADKNYISPNFKIPIVEFYSKGPVAEFLADGR